MRRTRVKVKILKEGAKLPKYGTDCSAGADLYACLDGALTVEPGQSVPVPVGISIELPRCTVGLIYARSGLACKRGAAPANKVGVIDSDYRGEIIVYLHNHSSEPCVIEPGERIAQLVIAPYIPATFEETGELTLTDRGTGGFGSTGRT